MRSPKEHRQADQVLIRAVVNEALRQELLTRQLLSGKHRHKFR